MVIKTLQAYKAEFDDFDIFLISLYQNKTIVKSIIAEYFNLRGLSTRKLAELLGVSHQSISNHLAEADNNRNYTIRLIKRILKLKNPVQKPVNEAGQELTNVQTALNTINGVQGGQSNQDTVNIATPSLIVEAQNENANTNKKGTDDRNPEPTKDPGLINLEPQPNDQEPKRKAWVNI